MKKVKIHSVEVVTDLGRRVVTLAAPIEVEVAVDGAMPPAFRGLTEMLWGLVREVAVQAPSPPPRAEA